MQVQQRKSAFAKRNWNTGSQLRICRENPCKRVTVHNFFAAP